MVLLQINSPPSIFKNFHYSFTNFAIFSAKILGIVVTSTLGFYLNL